MDASAAAVRDSLEDRTPMALLGYQQRWCADPNPVKVIEKSRRIGLSWGEAADTALLAASNSGMNSFYIGYTKDMAKEFIHDCASFASAYSLAAGEITESEEVWFEGEERKSIFVFTLRFASGWRIEALSSTPRNLRGKQGRVIIDEAAFHPRHCRAAEGRDGTADLGWPGACDQYPRWRRKPVRRVGHGHPGRQAALQPVPRHLR